MYPRLFLAKNLLREDGVIFISIDDNEVHNLRALCNEVFGEENFISQAGWQKVYSPKNQARHLSNDYEYVLIYCKQIIGFNVGLLPRTEEMNKRYSNPDNDPRGDWKAGDLVAAGERKGGHYIVKNPISGKEYDVPSGKHWAFSEDTMKTLLAENRITFGKNGDSFPSFKQFLSEVKQGRVPSSLLSYKDYGHTDEAKKDFIKLFGEEGRTIFETLKPIRLIKNLALIGDTDSDSIILDFFAGSATTAHAVMDLNKEDGGNRKFICVQLPEPCDEKSEAFKAGYQTIAEISKERIRRAAAKIKAEQTEAQEKADLFDDGTANTVLDLGFRVFKLQKSNFKVWDANTPKDPEAIQQALELHVDHIDPQAEQEAILFELLLKSGFELTTPIQKFTLADKQVYSIAHDILLICLDKALTSEVIREMAELNPSRVICLDEGFQDNDQLKTNAVLIMKSKGVNDFRTV
jgi:adenine-specific DNA-methyltransferase